MRTRLTRLRGATVVAAALALMVTGITAGAAGSALILGQSNDSGTAQTVLQNAGTGAAFTLRTTNVSTNATGIFGWSSSTSQNATRGVYGRADGENSYGVYAVNNSPDEGSGAALFVDGNQNEGIIATSDDTNAVRGLVTDCDGAFLCGGNGVAGQGFGFGAGVFGDGANGIAGVFGIEGAVAGVYATATTADRPAMYADSAAGTGVVAFGNLGAPQTVETDAGGAFMGFNGVYGQTDSVFGAGVYGQSNGGLNFALFGSGNGSITGNWQIGGTCTGCTVAAVSINNSTTTLQQGDAVALDGVTMTDDGSIVLMVRPATDADTVIGVVDRQLKDPPDTLALDGVKRTVQVNNVGEREIAGASETVTAPKGLWEDGGTSVPAGSYLRIITSGVYAFDGAAPEGVAVGDALAVADSAGELGKASAEVGAVAHVGTFLGVLTDGRIVLYVSPR